jgi:hypothetical protein
MNASRRHHGVQQFVCKGRMLLLSDTVMEFTDDRSLS